MKILLVIPTLELGGAEKVVEALGIEWKQCENLTVKVVSLYSQPTPISAELQKNGIEVQFLDKTPGFDYRLIGKLRKVIVEFHPDIIHCHLYSLIYCRLASLNYPGKLVYTVHSLADKEVGVLQRKLYGLLFRRMGVQPVAISPEIQQSVIDEYGLPKNQVPIIQNGVRLSQFVAKEDYRLGAPAVLLHVGSFKPAKNHQLLLRSFAELQAEWDSRLILVGDGPLKMEVKSLADELKVSDKVEFAGVQSDVRPYLARADIFLLPSSWEGLPISIIEAMASALPIVATDVGGLGTLIKNSENGLLTELTQAAFTEAILTLLTDVKLREHLGRCAKIDAENYSSKTMANQYYALFQEWH